LPQYVQQPRRFPLGAYRGLRFGLMLDPQFTPEVYLEGAITRRCPLSREHRGPRAVLNALERLAGGYASECGRVRQELAIAESQLRDYKARLGASFPHDSYLSELTALRDQLKAGLAGAPAGARREPDDFSATTAVWRTGRPARVDEDAWSTASGPFADFLRTLGLSSVVASPITVQDRLWGALAVTMTRNTPPPDTEARLAFFTELVGTAISNAENLAELTASRARIVATADETRRKIERDLHDGAQQRLVSLALALRAAQMAVPQSGELRDELAHVAEGLVSVQNDLREMARGIHPAILAQGGLAPALKTLARRCSVPVELEVRAQERLPERVEVAAYYVVSEALANAAKHAHASVIHVDAEAADHSLRLCVRDDGAGGADPVRGSGLVGLKDRIEALGGTITIDSPAGEGTSLHAELPLPG